MRTTLTRWIRANLLCLLLFISVPCFAESEELVAPPPPELPRAVWHALLNSGGGDYILRADFQQVLGLPELALYLEEKENLEWRRVPFFGRLINATSALEPIAESVSELWKIDGQSTLFGRGGLSRDEVISAYRSFGWSLIDGENGFQFLQQPLDDADEAQIMESLEDYRRNQEFEKQELAAFRAAAQEGDEDALQYLERHAADHHRPSSDLQDMELQLRSEQERGKWRVVPGETGWISLTGPRSEPGSFSLRQPSEEEMAEFRDFPLGTFLEESPQDLFLIAMIFPRRQDENRDHEIKLDEEQGPHRARLERELHQLRQEEMSLRGNRGADILNRIGNMLLRINEIDGGIDLDLNAEIPGDPRDSFTTEAVQMGLGFLRMSIISISPQLGRELLDTTVSASANRLHASANISHASLMDFLHQSADKQRRLQEIIERMGELQEEMMALEQAEGGP